MSVYKRRTNRLFLCFIVGVDRCENAEFTTKWREIFFIDIRQSLNRNSYQKMHVSRWAPPYLGRLSSSNSNSGWRHHSYLRASCRRWCTSGSGSRDSACAASCRWGSYGCRRTSRPSCSVPCAWRTLRRTRQDHTAVIIHLLQTKTKILVLVWTMDGTCNYTTHWDRGG